MSVSPPSPERGGAQPGVQRRCCLHVCAKRLFNEFQAAIVHSSALHADHRDKDDLSWVRYPPHTHTPPLDIFTIAHWDNEKLGDVGWLRMSWSDVFGEGLRVTEAISCLLINR